jgi:hypothetical protein
MLFGAAQRNTINTDHIRTRDGIICDAAVIIAGGLGKCSIARLWQVYYRLRLWQV